MASSGSASASRNITLADDIQFIPTRVLDDLMQRRPLTHTVTDDLSSFTIVALRALLIRLSTEGHADAMEEQLLALLSAQCPFELWMNRQQVRDEIKQLAEEAEDSDASADSQASTCSRHFAPFVPALHEMLQVNDEQRWEMHRLRAEGRLGHLEDDSESPAAEQYYRDYIRAVTKMPEDDDHA
ncbi:hypothetical protein OH76DRAFT_1396686 [Lentinus brumalis]|uniref:Uncharacterized protein n=1 Tax=Lentinus brumalis TaxID=2498619 RepID=A0A371DRW4_9APHY|nr:hypothetical protein OH76DRAFT_1396686 [Polyporus brumalis]